MLGAIIGDISGSRFEWENIKTKEFEFLASNCYFTDDSVLTLAVAQALLDCDANPKDFAQACTDRMREYALRYPRAGYGETFALWAVSDRPDPYNSWGNGSAMRVSPCGWAAGSLEEAMTLAELSAAVTHNHPEGIKGAQATAVAIYLARTGKSIPEIRDYIREQFYPVEFTLDEIRADYTYDISCMGSVPPAAEAFFESTSFEDTVRNAISIGGDSDTLGAIAGSMAESYYGIPGDIRARALTFLPEDLLQTLNAFETKYGIPAIK